MHVQELLVDLAVRYGFQVLGALVVVVAGARPPSTRAETQFLPFSTCTSWRCGGVTPTPRARRCSARAW